jgi:hypothetical protein
VFDNADDVGMWAGSQTSDHLNAYLPRSATGAIVFTTRDRKSAVALAQQHIIELKQMDKDTATQMLRKRLIKAELTDNVEDTTNLLTQLTCLPLAIVQAAAYINKNDIGLSTYLSLLNKQDAAVIDLLSEQFEDDYRYSNVKNPVATTWVISFK